MNIKPIRLNGDWTNGWALDHHTIYSEHLGEDAFGHQRYKTTRSEIGEMVFQLKYRNNSTVVPEIVNAVSGFLNKQGLLDNIDIILPAPPSKPRVFQPVFAIAEDLAELTKIYYSNEALVKTSDVQSKELLAEEKQALTNSVSFIKSFKRTVNILLVDDIFQTGKTLTECVNALRCDSHANNIYVITMTKTK